MPFVAGRSSQVGGVLGDQRLVDEIYASVDTYGGGLRLLHDQGLWPEDPHHLWQGFTGRRRNLMITMCAGFTGGAVHHAVSIGDATRKLERRLSASA